MGNLIGVYSNKILYRMNNLYIAYVFLILASWQITEIVW